MLLAKWTRVVSRNPKLKENIIQQFLSHSFLPSSATWLLQQMAETGTEYPCPTSGNQITHRGIYKQNLSFTTCLYLPQQYEKNIMHNIFIIRCLQFFKDNKNAFDSSLRTGKFGSRGRTHWYKWHIFPQYSLLSKYSSSPMIQETFLSVLFSLNFLAHHFGMWRLK